MWIDADAARKKLPTQLFVYADTGGVKKAITTALETFINEMKRMAQEHDKGEHPPLVPQQSRRHLRSKEWSRSPGGTVSRR